MESTDKLTPDAVIEALDGFLHTTRALLEVLPGASLQDLQDYAAAVLQTPVSAVVLCAALNKQDAPAPVAHQPAPAPATRRRM